MIYDFIWHDFCDWYLEIIKPRVELGGKEKALVLGNSARILRGSMQLLHPIMPFITEEIWQRLNNIIGDDNVSSIMISEWPAADSSLIDETIESQMKSVKSLIGVVRNIRNEMNVPLGKKADVIVAPANEKAYRIFFDNRDFELEKTRLNKEIERRTKFIGGVKKKLNNEGFLAKAPEDVIKLERRKLEDSCQELEKLTANLEALGA